MAGTPHIRVLRTAGATLPGDCGTRKTLPGFVANLNSIFIINEIGGRPMKFRPLHDRVVLERIDAEEKTAGGIIIPDTAKEKPQQGKVVAVGPGGRDESGKLIPIDVTVGDRVLFGKWSGTEVKIDGVEYLIMKESDIMGVLTGVEAKKKAA
jgi:chaperonin GroES